MYFKDRLLKFKIKIIYIINIDKPIDHNTYQSNKVSNK